MISCSSYWVVVLVEILNRACIGQAVTLGKSAQILKPQMWRLIIMLH